MPYLVKDEAETLDGIIRNEPDEVESSSVASAPCFPGQLIWHALQNGMRSGSKTARGLWLTSTPPTWLEYGWLAHVSTSGIDAAGKLRPSSEELKAIGPEFRERWETFFKEVPDKPVVWFGAVSEYVSLASLSIRSANMIW